MASYILDLEPHEVEMGRTLGPPSHRSTRHTLPDTWSTGNNRRIQPDDTFPPVSATWPPRITGSGIFASSVYLGPHWDGSGRTSNHAKVEFQQPAELRFVESHLMSYLIDVDRKGYSGTQKQAAGTYGSYRFYL